MWEALLGLGPCMRVGGLGWATTFGHSLTGGSIAMLGAGMVLQMHALCNAGRSKMPRWRLSCEQWLPLACHCMVC